MNIRNGFIKICLAVACVSFPASAVPVIGSFTFAAGTNASPPSTIVAGNIVGGDNTNNLATFTADTGATSTPAGTQGGYATASVTGGVAGDRVVVSGTFTPFTSLAGFAIASQGTTTARLYATYTGLAPILLADITPDLNSPINYSHTFTLTSNAAGTVGFAIVQAGAATVTFNAGQFETNFQPGNAGFQAVGLGPQVPEIDATTAALPLLFVTGLLGLLDRRKKVS